MSKRRVPSHVAKYLDENFALYDDISQRSDNIRKLAEDINLQNNYSGDDEWNSEKVKKYYYKHASRLRNSEKHHEIPNFKMPNLIFHNNSPCHFVTFHQTQNNETHCYYKCSQCGTCIATRLVGDNKIELLKKNIHQYCIEQSQHDCNVMTNLFFDGVSKAETLLKENKALGKFSCINALIKEIPSLQGNLKLAEKMVQTASKETRKVNFIDAILQSATEYKRSADDPLLFVLQYPRHTIAFCSSKQREQLKKSNILFVDGTFDDTSPEFKKGQLLNFLTINEEGFPLPLIHVLMTQRNEESYIRTFEDLKHFGCDFSKIQRVMCDFENALINGLKTINEGVQINGCFYHYCSALNKYITATFVKNNTSQLLFSIFKNIVIAKKRNKKLIIYQLKQMNNQALNTFLEYYCEQWLSHQSLKYLINIDHDDPITNNVCESFHSQLPRFCDASHPHITKLSYALMELWNKYSSDAETKEKEKQERYQFKTLHDIVQDTQKLQTMIREGNLICKTAKLKDRFPCLEKIEGFENDFEFDFEIEITT